MSIIDIIMRLTGAREAAADAKLASTAIASTGDASVAAGAKARKGAKGMGIMRSGILGVAKLGKIGLFALAGGLTAVALATKSAVTASIDLSKVTAGLHRNLGLTNKEGSRWAVLAKARDIDSKSLTMSFTTLSRQIVAARGDADAFNETFGRLGLTQKDVAMGSKDFTGFVGKLADAFGNAEGGAERQAVAQKLLGRGYQTILPLFSSGSDGLREQLGWADKYHATMSGKMVKDNMELVSAQRELNVAWQGFQLVLARSVVPALTKLMPYLMDGVLVVSEFVQGMEDGAGAGGKFARGAKWVGGAVSTASGYVSKGISVVKGFVGELLHGEGETRQFAVGVAGIATRIFKLGRGIVMWALPALKQLWKGAKTTFEAFILIVRGAVKVIDGIFSGDWKQVWSGMKDLAGGAIRTLKGAVQTLLVPFVFTFTAIKGVVTTVVDWIADKIEWIVDKLTSAKNTLDSITPGGGGGLFGTGVGPDFGGSPIPDLPSPGDLIPGKLVPTSEPTTPGRPAPVRAKQAEAAYAAGVAHGNRRGRETVIPITLKLDGKTVMTTVVKHQEDEEARL